MNTVGSELLYNAVLKSIPREEFAHLRPYLSNVRLVANQVIVEPGERCEHVFFIQHGVVSIGHELSTSSRVQVALVGSESLVGCQAFLQSDAPSFTSAIMQHSGSALRVPVRDLMGLMDGLPSLKAACMQAVMSLMKQVTETAASNARDSLARRCIRLLLTLHDRVHGEDVQVTHQALSDMLGVRRSGVTQVATDLQRDGLICINRGRITILDRSAMERQLPRSNVVRPLRHPAPSIAMGEATAA